MSGDALVCNARISSTMLGTEDHGILTCSLFVEGDSWAQGFGGHELDEWSNTAGRRVPHAECGRWVSGILSALEVPAWEKLPGTVVRIRRDQAHGGVIVAIGHAIKERWFLARADASAVGTP